MTIDFSTGESHSLRIVLAEKKGDFAIQLVDGSDTLGYLKYDDEVWLFHPNPEGKRFFFSFELEEIADFIHMLEAFQFAHSRAGDDLDLSGLIDSIGKN
jgi:hypothetical protein